MDRFSYQESCHLNTHRLAGFADIGFAPDPSGDGDIRLTVEQNAIFSGVPDDKVQDLLAQPLMHKFPTQPANLSANLVSCTGNQFCGFAKIETKNTAVAMTEKLEAALDVPAGVRIHWTGCTNSCGQVQVRPCEDFAITRFCYLLVDHGISCCKLLHFVSSLEAPQGPDIELNKVLVLWI